MTQERRYLPQTAAEVRAITDDNGVDHIPGRGIVFNQWSRKLGWFKEKIEPTALDYANMEEMKSFYNHDPNYTLASLRNKTVSITISETSCDYDIIAPDNQTIKDMVLAPIKRGDVTGSSFMFDIAEDGDEWERGADGVYLRTIYKIETVYEMGPVSMPAYLQTSTSLVSRSLDEVIAMTKKAESNYRRQRALMHVIMLQK
jgi:HK97 family phage prohead protease